MLRSLSLHRRCRRRAEQIRLPRPFSIDSLRRHISEQRGRPLYLHALPLETASAGACGLWLATTEDDHIFYEQRTSALHQEHIVLHEFGHMLFGHRSMAGGETLRAALPDLDPRLVVRLLGRTDYSNAEEREAELLASLLRSEVDLAPRRVRHGPLAGLSAALGVGNPG